MQSRFETYIPLDSVLHRCEPRWKVLGFVGLILAFAFVDDVRSLPIIISIAAFLYWLSNLPLSFLLRRLRYPGYVLLGIILLLPLLSGQTVIWQWGILTLRQEGCLATLLIAGRFLSIVTLGIILLGTTPVLRLIRVLRSLGLPTLLTDMMLLFYRYLFETATMLTTMQTAMGLRGFRQHHHRRWALPSVSDWCRLASLAGTLLIRSYEQSERVYTAMRLRGYGKGENGEMGRWGDGEMGVEMRRWGDGEAGEDRDGGEDGKMRAILNPEPQTAHQALRAGYANTPQTSNPALRTPHSAPYDVITLNRLGFSYPDRADVLRDINLQVGAGERVGVIGPNGAGKTTLFMLLCGVLLPTTGEIVILNQPVALGQFRSEVGLVFQNPDDQLFSASVWDDVAFGLQNMGFSPEEVEQRVRKALLLTGTLDLAQRPPHHLSGGEKRMVAIAGILAMRPQLIIYDEPSANLDLGARRRLIQFLHQSDQTLLIASHDLEFLLEVCDRILLIHQGRIVADGNPRTIMGDASLMVAHGLEVPHSLTHSHP